MLDPKTQIIPFASGINRAADKNAVSAGGFLELDNCVFDQDGAVVGRPVLTSSSRFSTATGTTFLRNGDQLALQTPAPYQAYRFAEVFPGQRVMSVEAALDASQGGRYTVAVMTALKEDETHAFYQTFTPLTFLALIDSDGRVVEVKYVGSGQVNPKIVSVAHSTYPQFMVAYGTGSDIYGVQVRVINGALSVGTPFSIRTAANLGKRSTFDLVSNNTTAYCVHGRNTGIEWDAFSGDSLAVSVSGTTYTTYGQPTDMWVEILGSNLFVVFYTGSWVIRSAVWSTSGGAVTSAQVIASGVTLPGVAVIIPGTYTGSAVLVAWNQGLNTLTWASCPTTGTSTTPLTAAGSYGDMMIASRASGTTFTVYSAKGYDTGYQALDLVTLTAGATAPLVLARLAQDDSAPLTLFTASGTADDSIGRYGFYQPRFLGSAPQSATGIFLPTLVAEANGAGESVPVDSAGLIRRVRIVRLVQDSAPATATVGRVQLVAGSIPTSWDGVRLAPAAALGCPAAPTLAPGAAGALSGVYSIRVVVEFVDARGLSWFSPPSPASGTATLVNQKKTCTATINARVMNAPVGYWKQFRLRFYSTTAGGSTYYLMSSFVMDAAAVFGDLDTTVSYDDNTTDGNLQLAEQLYSQTSDTYELAPPLSHICAHGNRFFGVRSDVPEMVMFTDEAQEGFLPRWNAARSFRVDNGAGPALACGSLNDQLVVLQAEQLCVVRGEGPTRSVADTTSFPLPVRFASVGVHPDRVGTVVSTAAGLFFVGRRNAYLITSDLQVTPVGSALGGANFWMRGTFSRARYLPSRNWVMLFGGLSGAYAGSPCAFVLDLATMRWTSFGNSAGWSSAYDAADVAGTTYLAVGGFAAPYVWQLTDQHDATPPFYERQLTASTVDKPVVQTIDLPWFRPDEATDIRLRKVVLSGRRDGVMPNITVSVYVQDERRATATDTPVHTHTWTGSSVTLPESFKLSFRSITQRCNAFRIRITITPTATSGAVYLNAVTYMYGITGPAGKAPTGNLPSAT